MDIEWNVIETLREGHYNYSVYSGCFDIVASRRGNFSPVFLKILPNIDSLQFAQANSLKILSKCLGAFAMVVGVNTRRERLEDNVAYERFEVTAVSPETLENMLVHNNLPSMYRFRGGMFMEVDREKLRRCREKKGLTQKGLAEKAGTTKKSIYEHEKSQIKIEYGIAARLEKTLGCSLGRPIIFTEALSTERVRPERFEGSVSRDLRHIGFRTEFVQQSPFNIIAREKFTLFLDASTEKRRIEKDAPYLEMFSGVVKKPVAAVVKGETNIDLPAIEERELKELSTARELERIIKKR